MEDQERKVWSAEVKRELGQAKRRAEREMGKISDELRATIDMIEHSVRKNPKRSAVVALALGAAIGAAGMRFLKLKKSARRRG